MSSAISSGLQGYTQAETSVNKTAGQVANWPSSQTGGTRSVSPGGDSAELSSAAIALLQGRNDAEANLATIHVADEMQRSTIDIMA